MNQSPQNQPKTYQNLYPRTLPKIIQPSQDAVANLIKQVKQYENRENEQRTGSGQKPSACGEGQGLRDGKRIQGIPISEQQGFPKRILLRQNQSPGDVLVLSAAIESLHICFPGKYLTGYSGTAPEIFNNNPRITRGLGAHDSEVMPCEYPAIHQSDNRPIHFMAGFCEDLARKINEPLQLCVKRPYLYLSDQEKVTKDFPFPYAVIICGHKQDFTAKHYGRKTAQEIVDHFAGRLKFIQVGEAGHCHKPLNNVIDLIGKTKTRQLITLCYHSVLGVGPETFLHHIYAALEKPYVCYIGGRMPISWQTYPTAVMLGAHGLLPCCQKRSCQMCRTVPLNDGDSKDKSLCVLPVISGDETIPKCMELIGSKPAINAIEAMIESGVVKL